MKKTILSLLTFAGILACADLRADEEGSIYEVAACTEIGGDIAESKYPIWPLSSNDLVKVSGHTAYFRLRLASADDSTGNYWQLRYYGSSQLLDWALFPPQVCLYVSGVERWASLIDMKNVEENGFKFTDLVFSYTTQSGDFAMPIVLGAKDGSGTKPALDPLVTTPEYYVDLKGKWDIEFEIDSSTAVTPNWWLMSTKKPGVSCIRDLNLANAGYNVQTVDFDSDWESTDAKTLWRSVHMDTAIPVGATPKLLRHAAAEKATSLYVWSTNELAVVVKNSDGTDGELVECDPENNPGVKYHVVKVTIGSSSAEDATGSFKLWGVNTNETASLGWSGLVMSPYKQFNSKNTTGEYYEDFVTVPVRCVEPLPPSVMVSVEDQVAYATSEYLTSATKIKVSLSQPTTEKFKVQLKPAFTEDNEPLEPEVWGKYVRFSTSQETVSSLPNATASSTEVELGGSINEAYVYVYALRGDTHTSGAVNAMEFQSVAVGTYPSEIEHFNKGQCQIVAAYPEIYAPETTTEDRLEAVQFDETPVTIKVAGSYADDADSTGYTIYIKYKPGDTAHDSGAPSGFKKLEGTYKPGDGGVLERADASTGDLPKFTWVTTGEYVTQIYVVAPVSGKDSRCGEGQYYDIYVNVTPTKSVKVYTKDEATEFEEGDQAQLYLELSEANSDEDMFAFLKIESDDVSAEQFSSGTAYVIGMTNKLGQTKGIKIGRSKGTSATPVTLPKLKFLDGYGPATGDYLGVDFTVVLAQVQDYTEATNKNKIVKGYESDVLQLQIYNIEPEVDYMQLGGFDSEKYSGYEYTFKLPMGQEQTLQAVVTEPSKYDLEHEFMCEWVISSAQNKEGPYTQRKKLYTEGNPASTNAVYNFPYVGWNRIALRVKDKDMDDYPEDAFLTYVEVLSQPTITVVPEYERPDETETGTKVSFGLTYFDSEIPLVMMVSVEPNFTTDDEKQRGELLFDNAYRKAPSGYETYEATNHYFLTFSSDIAQDMAIVRMDGTDNTDNSGFFLKAQILNEEENPKTQVKWCDYYVKNLTTRIYPRNIAPNGGDESISFWPDANPTSRWAVAGGTATSHPLTWRLRSDVALDMQGGVEVQILGGGGTNATYYGVTSGIFTPNFGSSQGDQDVTIIIKDKDGDMVSRTWCFTVTASKFMTLVAHGPSSGISTSTESKKYRSVAGIGKGHVYATSPANFDSASDFWLKWNCSNAAAVPVYAWGYKVANPLDNGSLDTHDQALDKNGSAKSATETISDYYKYEDSEMRDSFFYAWIIEAVTSSSTDSSTSSSSAKTYTVTISPEQPELGATVGSVSLPTSRAQGSTTSDAWPETQAEAVFSREYLWSDNMGDINADGIPDLWMVMCGFTTSSETTNQMTGQTSTETSEVSDIDDVAAYNKDKKSSTDTEEVGDYLPAGLAVQQLSGEVAVEFTAWLEVRGFGDHLNNAPQLGGVAGAKPEIRYTNPENDGSVITNRSTLSKLEFGAWCDFAAANDIANPEDPTSWYDENGNLRWSPERPTNPTLVDSDNDGFPDGLEYWYWYRAHVGYFDAKGNHIYQTGRKFDPMNPAEGVLITSAEIEAQMDPINASNVVAKYADSDNDGIPDLLEYVLGTDPFDFDTDQDGLPDGWEVVCSCTDPCGAESDAERNNDGDAMAISSPALESAVTPTPLKITGFQTFAAIIDGQVQWFATQSADEIAVADATETMNVITLDDGKKYATRSAVKVSVNGTLGNTLLKSDTYLLNEDNVATMPAYVAAGTKVTLEENVEVTVKTLTDEIAEDNLHACWVYGRDSAKDSTLGELNTAASATGFLTLGKNLAAPAGAQICFLPTTEIDVAYLHYLVYEEFGFDPRTAWKDTSPLHARWTLGSEYTDIIKAIRGGYTANATRTRAFTAIDEFLVMSFFANNGTLTEEDLTPTASTTWSAIWAKYTTNPRGPGETTGKLIVAADTETDTEAETEDSEELSDNGADTDEDGVPDGWELYIMAGSKKEGKFVFAPPYAGFETGAGTSAPKSLLSPFVADAQKSDTDNLIYIGSSDTLNEFREFGGTDTILYYTSVCSNQTSEITITRDAADAKWINKFFPTDPWNTDTDGDGVTDSAEGAAFIYGTPEDDSTLRSIPGGGLNPCSVDTDIDGLPDGWENQFKGSTEYAGEFLEQTRTGDNKTGNSEFGLTDGMDGTVADAVTRVNNISQTQTTDADGITSTTNTVTVTINRDYDHDGLENWQEYLVGSMRCWRYDDPVSPWTYIKSELYWASDGWAPQYSKLGVENEDEFWYRTLVDTTSPIYNPRLVTDMSVGNTEYFTRLDNGWDPAYYDSTLSDEKYDGAYYIFKDQVGGKKIKDAWVGSEMSPGPLADVILNSGCLNTPKEYISCSPIDPDTDYDGMDDYYELFHGMNPLLGQSGNLRDSEGPYDVVAEAWANSGSTFYAWGSGNTLNYWQINPLKEPRGTGYDFEVFPWLTGTADADPDGDDIRNQEEAIMPELATTTWHHTDPTPLWMTDKSYSNSLVSLYFKMPARMQEVVPSATSFTFDGTTYSMADFAWWTWDDAKQESGKFVPYTPDAWNMAQNGYDNWAYSFEENEGYDTDHDGISDFEELQGKYGEVTKPQDAESPLRRQAMYFQGPERPSALQSPAYVKENHPVGMTDYEDDLEFLQYTVECWVRPDAESVAQGVYATILERGVWVNESNAGDEEYLRCNFQLAIRDGKWYTKFDNRGTLVDSIAELTSDDYAKSETWTHLAATFDGQTLTLYVNGNPVKSMSTELQPEYGSSAVAVQQTSMQYSYSREYKQIALLMGASFQTCADGMQNGKHLDVENAMGWDCYKNFFKGYVDEVRIWDGARSAKDVMAAMNSRFTAEEINANRDQIYTEWRSGVRRYKATGTTKESGMSPELRYHYSFDGVSGAENETAVAKVPHNFDALKGPFSRPEDWEIGWWARVLNGYADTVYGDSRFVMWVNNTVTHLPRFDGTTWDSMYLSTNFMGDVSGTYNFQYDAEPGSRWTQMAYNNLAGNSVEAVRAQYRSTTTRHHLVNSLIEDVEPSRQFEFTGRKLHQQGDDLLPLGGAYVKTLGDYAESPAMWDGDGAMANWENTGDDADADGLPDWWEEYADENYRINPGEQINWSTLVNHEGSVITAGEAYLFDLVRGFHSDENGFCVVDKAFAQTADTDKDGVIDYYAKLYNLTDGNGALDSNGNGLSNYAEYFYNEVLQGTPKLTLPTAINSNGKAEDYFRKFGSLYLGEIFTDHDQVDDAWETVYSDVASTAKYDPERDDDGDGWSNYAEAMAGTRPDSKFSSGVDANTEVNFPVPVIEAEVSYNGKNAKNTGYLVFKAWNENIDPEMTGVPDAVWSISTTAGTSADYSKYVGLKPTSQREFVLHGGAIEPGTVVVKFMDPNYFYSGTVNRASSESTSNQTYAADARWYSGITDKGGTLYNWANTEVGTVDYTTGKLVVDFAALDGYVLGNPQDNTIYGALTYKDVYRGDDYEVLTLGQSYVKIGWTSVSLSNEVDGKHYLVDPDEVTTTSSSSSDTTATLKQLGRLREGKNSFICYLADSAGGDYVVGKPFGFVKGVEVGWQSGKFQIELSETSAITPRFSPWSDGSDRTTTYDVLAVNDPETEAARLAIKSSVFSPAFAGVTNQVVNGNAANDKARLRIVRFGLNDRYAYICGVGTQIRQRIVLEREYDKNGREFFHEGDFLADGELDLDWDNLYGEVVSDSNVRSALGGNLLTNVTYLAVLDGGNYWVLTGADSNNVIRAATTVIERRFEVERHAPVGEKPADIEYGARPTFTWSIPEEDAWAKQFGSSYTAFEVQVFDADAEEETIVYDSGVLRAPVIKNGKFTWKAPAAFESIGNWAWRVRMYNAKFSPAYVATKSEGDGWSEKVYFSTAINSAQPMNDNGYSSINVAVKYTGPVVAAERLNSEDGTGHLYVQAFDMPDYSGEPLAETEITDLVSLTNAYDLTANCTLKGLTATGTYFVRAFLDANGNGVKDDFESWGAVAEGVALNTSVVKVPEVALFLEDADTDNDMYPDAYEYAAAGWTGDWSDVKDELKANMSSEGQLILSSEVVSAISNGFARTSTGLSGLRITAFQNINLAKVLMAGSLGDSQSLATMEDLRKAVAKQSKVKENTLKITAFNFNATAKSVNLYLDAEVETTTAGSQLLKLYDLGTGIPLTVKVYQRQNLATNDWGTPVTKTVMVTSGQTEVEVTFDNLDTSSGFFKVEVEQ